MPLPSGVKQQRWWPKLSEAKVHPSVELAFRQAFNGIYNLQDAFTTMTSEALLHATINTSGNVTAVDVVKPGQYPMVPTVKTVGGGGSGATFTVTLDRNGGIASVKVVSGGSLYVSPPYLVIQ